MFVSIFKAVFQKKKHLLSKFLDDLYSDVYSLLRTTSRDHVISVANSRQLVLPHVRLFLAKIFRTQLLNLSQHHQRSVMG